MTSQEGNACEKQGRRGGGREGGREGCDLLVVGVGGNDDEAVSASDLLQDADEDLAVRKPRGEKGREGEKAGATKDRGGGREGGREAHRLTTLLPTGMSR